MSGITNAFFHITAGSVVISSRNIIGSSVSPSACSATLQLTNTGILNTIASGVGTIPIAGEWLVGSDSGASFEAFVTVTAGTLTSGTTGSWVSLGTTVSWTKTQASIGTSTVTFTIQIRETATQIVRGTATITLDVEVAA